MHLVGCIYPVQDAIVPFIMPFVTENIGKNSAPEDWRLREAATFAFGSMLEGPSPTALADIVRQAMGFLLAVSQPHQCACGFRCARQLPATVLSLSCTRHPAKILEGKLFCQPSHAVCLFTQAMKDPHPYVRDTTAWTISRVFEFQHDASNANVPELITRETLPQVAQVSSTVQCSVLSLGSPASVCTDEPFHVTPTRVPYHPTFSVVILPVQVLMAALQDQPHIAARVCDAIGKMAEGFKDYTGV